MNKFVLYGYLFFVVIAGNNASIHEKVVICGVCKDVAGRLPFSIKIMEKIGALFSDYRIVVYENNSSDNTVDILKAWEGCNSRVLMICEQLEKANLEKFFRPECIARARNIVLDKVLSEEFQDFDYLVWMDMDFRVEPNYDAFTEVFQSDKAWDAVFANGVAPDGTYWDWYAFRDNNNPLGPELLGRVWWDLQKQFKTHIKDDWHLVYSAFAGCAIYKKSSIKNCRYSGLVTTHLAELYNRLILKHATHPLVQQYINGLASFKQVIDVEECLGAEIKDPAIGIASDIYPDEIIWRIDSVFTYKYPVACEHVNFHAAMALNGHDKLFINPRLLFYYN